MVERSTLLWPRLSAMRQRVTRPPRRRGLESITSTQPEWRATLATLDEAVSILDRLAKELAKRRPDVDELDNAYRGEHKLRFASDDFRDYFADRYNKFSDNWCGIVADAPHERLEITGIRLDGNDKGDASLWQ